MFPACIHIQINSEESQNFLFSTDQPLKSNLTFKIFKMGADSDRNHLQTVLEIKTCLGLIHNFITDAPRKAFNSTMKTYVFSLA